MIDGGEYFALNQGGVLIGVLFTNRATAEKIAVGLHADAEGVASSWLDKAVDQLAQRLDLPLPEVTP